jgi:hypothetical protein
MWIKQNIFWNVYLLGKFSLNFHCFLIFSQKEPPSCKNLPPKIKQKILLTKGGWGVIQLFDAKISPNYVYFISTKVKCIATLFF